MSIVLSVFVVIRTSNLSIYYKFLLFFESEFKVRRRIVRVGVWFLGVIRD